MTECGDRRGTRADEAALLGSHTLTHAAPGRRANGGARSATVAAAPAWRGVARRLMRGAATVLLYAVLVVPALALGGARLQRACIPGRSDPGCYEVEAVGSASPVAGVTLVTQVTHSKLAKFELALRAWDGFVSVALYAYDEAELQAFRSYACNRCVVTVVHGGKRKQAYPINLLRQIALERAVTELVLVFDSDFLPSPGLHGQLLQLLPPQVVGTAYVLPAFEFTRDVGSALPATYEQVQAACADGTMAVFHGKRGGHHFTKTERWLSSDSEYCVRRTGSRYEPYVVVNTSNAGFPRFDERYVNRGMNKVSWALALKAANFSFCVLPRVWVMHVWEARPRYLKPFVRLKSERGTELLASADARARLGTQHLPSQTAW